MAWRLTRRISAAAPQDFTRCRSSTRRSTRGLVAVAPEDRGLRRGAEAARAAGGRVLFVTSSTRCLKR